MNFSKNDPGYAMFLAHEADKRETLDPLTGLQRKARKHTHRRWEDDNQEGGAYRRFTPGVTRCPQCNHVIYEQGNCDMEYWLAPKPFYGRGRECGGHG